MSDVKQRTLEILVFVHQKLVATAYYPEEFKVSEAALALIKDMAERLHFEIQSEVQVEPTESEKV